MSLSTNRPFRAAATKFDFPTRSSQVIPVVTVTVTGYSGEANGAGGPFKGPALCPLGARELAPGVGISVSRQT
jgi:hypothetical protein